MKKTIFVICTIVCSMYVHAQETQTAAEAKPTAKFGIKGGLNLTNLYVDNVKDENIKPGVNAGFYAKIPVTKNFSVQPEILYSMKGAQMNYNNLLGSGKYRFNLDYLEVPVAAVINVAKNFNIHAGPYAAFLLSAKVQDVDKNGNINGATELNKDNFESLDYGVFGGVAFDVGNVTIGGRYTYGLKEIGKAGLSGNLTENSKNSAISFYLGFGF
ncbi:PorT family protein [Ferruginibacter lapsinanis]|uniref:porin family protein n=1 Tax=Ferruginibacter lapsinanis TaxID=563172 RepID=UPI001E2C51EC|nr:porin family protein [Ferruginibacter lapsinanis]UEG51039.1 PorT family protein [Ferruginibacter lapsinanis]